MFKQDIPPLVWVFDMEWVPDAVAAKRLLDLPDSATELESFQALWKHAGGTDENPRPFLKHLYSRVVSIAFLSRHVIYRGSDKCIGFALYSLPKLPIDGTGFEEANIIEQFLYFVGERCPQLVGFNSSDSDIQVLIQRGMINEVTAPIFCSRPGKPWEGRDYFDSRNSEWHLDILKRFSNYSMTPRLNDFARLCGFPGKMDVSGDQVWQLWLNRDVKAIVEYNQIDALNTYLVWLRMVYFAGKLKREEYVTEQESFRSFLEAESQKPHMEHIGRFLDKWEI